MRIEKCIIIGLFVRMIVLVVEIKYRMIIELLWYNVKIKV